MTEHKDQDPIGRKSRGADSPPSIVFGWLMAVLLGPIAVTAVVMLANGRVTTPSGYLVAAALIVGCTAVISHFFFGHVATWILPMLVISLGIMGIVAGVYGREAAPF